MQHATANDLKLLAPGKHRWATSVERTRQGIAVTDPASESASAIENFQPQRFNPGLLESFRYATACNCHSHTRPALRVCADAPCFQLTRSAAERGGNTIRLQRRPGTHYGTRQQQHWAQLPKAAARGLGAPSFPSRASRARRLIQLVKPKRTRAPPTLAAIQAAVPSCRRSLPRRPPPL